MPKKATPKSSFSLFKLPFGTVYPIFRHIHMDLASLIIIRIIYIYTIRVYIYIYYIYIHTYIHAYKMYIRYSDKIPMISRWFLPSIHSFDQKSALLRHLYGAFRLARRIFLQLKSRDSLRVLKSLLRCHVFGGGLKICCGLVYAVFSVFVWSIFGCFRLSVWLIPVFI